MSLKPVHTRYVQILLAITILLVTGWLSAYFFVPSRSSAESLPVWCFDIVQDEQGGVHQFGHPPTAESVKNTADESVLCFDNWADVASYVTDGQVQLPPDATKEDYVNATEELFRRPGAPPVNQ